MTSATLLKRYATNRECIESLYDSLLEKYDGRYVAVQDGKVIAAADSIDTLRLEIGKATLFGSEDGTAIAYITSDTSSMLL